MQISIILVAMNRIQNRFGRRVRRLRERAGLSQERFAEECGLHRTYIGAVERGERNISLVNIERIARALGITIQELFKEISRRGKASRSAR